MRAYPVCTDCGRLYQSLKTHKSGVTKTCRRNQMGDECNARARRARTRGWEPVQQWHNVIQRCGVPIMEMPVVMQSQPDFYYNDWAPTWAMEVARLKQLDPPARIRAIQRLFAEVDRRKVFQAELSMQQNKFYRSRYALTVARQLNFMSNTFYARD